MTPEQEHTRKIARRKVNQEKLADDLAVAIKNIEFWQGRQKERWKAKDPRRAEICGKIITLYQQEAGKINKRLASWA